MGGRAAVATVLLAATVLSGCVTFAGGSPSPAVETSSTDTEPTTEDANGAPHVDEPLDASPFLDDPCSVLTSEQLAGFGVVEPGEATGGAVAEHAGPQCIWNATPEVDSNIDVGFVTADENGLADLYGVREREAYFIETTVQGYPAVFHDQDDYRDTGFCNISVGISDTLSFRTAEYGNRDAQESCDRAKEVADAVITTLKGTA